MEQFTNDGMYIIDLSEVNTTPEIIFELSSILEKEEVRNKKICLKLGNVSLNQAQLLSIKSLISGIDSTLTCIDTKSVETEKVALSLGIIISNISAENTLEVMPETPYKMAEEIKPEVNEEKENKDNESEQNSDESYNIVEEEDITEQNNSEIIQETTKEKENDNNVPVQEVNEQETEEKQENTEEEHVKAEHIENQDISISINSGVSAVVDENAPKQKEDIQDELDVIFGSGNGNNSIFNIDKSDNLYDQKEELTDIVVPELEYTKEDIELETFPTKYIKQTLRSGQVISYEGNIVIIGDCHPGCEITAFGDITVWGVLSGIAHAGSAGNQKARVRALKMNAIQLRIANCYSRRPDSLNTVYIEKTNSYTPEEARIINNEIVVFKMND